MVSPNQLNFKKVTSFGWGGHFFVWLMYAAKIVTTIPRIVKTRESNSYATTFPSTTRAGFDITPQAAIWVFQVLFPKNL